MTFWSALAGPRSDIYQAARVGDLDRIKHLVEEDGVDVNTRDRWDSVPLYYACLAGILELFPQPASGLRPSGQQCPARRLEPHNTLCSMYVCVCRP